LCFDLPRGDGPVAIAFLSSICFDREFPEWTTDWSIEIPAAWLDLFAMEEPARTDAWMQRERAFLEGPLLGWSEAHVRARPHLAAPGALRREEHAWRRKLASLLDERAKGRCDLRLSLASPRASDDPLDDIESDVLRRVADAGGIFPLAPPPRGDYHLPDFSFVRIPRFPEGREPVWAKYVETVLSSIDRARRAQANGWLRVEREERAHAVEAVTKLRHCGDAVVGRKVLRGGADGSRVVHPPDVVNDLRVKAQGLYKKRIGSHEGKITALDREVARECDRDERWAREIRLSLGLGKYRRGR